MTERTPCPCKEWEQMSTEELDRVLQAELRKEHPDEHVVLPILRTIENRENETPMVQASETFETFGQFSKHDLHIKQSKLKRGWIAGIAAAAAAVCIFVMALPKTTGAESIMEILYRWTSGIFEFFTPEQDATNPPVDYVFDANNPGLYQLYDKLTELGVSKPIVPTWLPDGFILLDLHSSFVSNGSNIHCNFGNGKGVILITYRVSSDIYAKLEKGESGFEVFDVGSTQHIIVENDGSFSVTWTVDGVACVLSTNVTKDELYTILKSIYRSELSQ